MAPSTFTIFTYLRAKTRPFLFCTFSLRPLLKRPKFTMCSNGATVSYVVCALYIQLVSVWTQWIEMLAVLLYRTIVLVTFPDACLSCSVFRHCCIPLRHHCGFAIAHRMGAAHTLHSLHVFLLKMLIRFWFKTMSTATVLHTHTHTDLCVSSHNKLDLIFYLRLPFQSFLASDSFDGVWWRLSMTELPSAVDNPTLDRHSLILCGPLNVSLS